MDRAARQAARNGGWRSAAMVVALIVCVLLLGAWASFIFIGRPVVRSLVCEQNAKNLAVSLQMYVTDFGAFPRADSWCDQLLTYTRHRGGFVCPERPDLECGYAYNRALSEVRLDQLQDPDHIIAVFESDRRWNAAGGRELLPVKPRHRGADYYVTAAPYGWWTLVKRCDMGNPDAGLRWTLDATSPQEWTPPAP